MRVLRVLMPGAGFESWTVLGDDLIPVASEVAGCRVVWSRNRRPSTPRRFINGSARSTRLAYQGSIRPYGIYGP